MLRKSLRVDEMAQNINGDQDRRSQKGTGALSEQLQVPIHLWHISVFCEEEMTTAKNTWWCHHMEKVINTPF